MTDRTPIDGTPSDRTPDQALVLFSAFQSAWFSLLQDDRMQAGDIETLPDVLLSGIFDAALVERI